MKLSTRARYGLRLCYLLGLGQELVSLSSLAKQAALSEKYLEQLLSMLKKGGIVEAKRGVSGGYMLKESPSQINIDRILTALDDNFDISTCALGGCEDNYCPNRSLFTRIHRDIKNVLTTTTLQDLINDSLCNARAREEV